MVFIDDGRVRLNAFDFVTIDRLEIWLESKRKMGNLDKKTRWETGCYILYEF